MARIAIIGAGYVGTGIKKLFPDSLLVDPPRGMSSYEEAIGVDLAIICVPTAMGPNGECDISIVEEAIAKLDAELILVKSTVTPGTCDRIRNLTGKRIVFSPEYMGESKYWTPPNFPSPHDSIAHGFMILGGQIDDCSAVADIFLPVLGPATRFRFMTAQEAELVKYAENSFFAVKVSFANLLRQICDASGANYHTVREGWLDDPRVGPMHTAAFAQAPGFNGKCLPKDTAALSHFCRAMDIDPALLEAAMQYSRGTCHA